MIIVEKGPMNKHQVNNGHTAVKENALKTVGPSFCNLDWTCFGHSKEILVY